MTAPLLQIDDLCTHFFTRDGVAKAVDGVSLSLGKGEILGLVGESGSGKSVTGFSILRLVDPPGRIVSGRIMFDGEDLASLDEERLRAIRGKRIAMIFQDPMMTLNPVLRIDTQMVEAVLAHSPMSHKAALDRCRQVLTMVGIAAPGERLKSYPHHFSGGMRQRVAIAIALLHEPDLIIADEPTTALDVTIQGQILAEMQKLCAETGTALIWISHDLAVVSALADRIAVMYAGRIVEQGKAAEIIDSAAPPLYAWADSVGAEPQQARRAAASDPRHGAADPRPAAGLRLPAPLSARQQRLPASPARSGAPSRPLGALFPPASRRSESGGRCMTPIIEIAGVSKRFVRELDTAQRVARAMGAPIEEQTVHAVDDVDLAVAPREVLGLVGESGCGKSTLGRMVAGLMTPSEGAIRFRGADVAGLKGKPAREAALKVQMIFQDPMSSLNPRMRVEAIVGEAPQVHGIVTRQERRPYVEEMLRHVGLDAAMHRRYPHQFSGGQRQRIGIARALAVRPDFLVCDEAIAALDVSIQAQVLNLFMRLRQAFDLTYLFISHDLGVVQHISDRIAIMYLGRIVEEGPTEAIFACGEPSLHAGSACRASRDRAGQAQVFDDQGRNPLAAQTAAGLPFPSALSASLRALPRRAPRAETDRAGRRSACHLNDTS